MSHSFCYGPVRSRRFGLSLGVDVVPFKSCTFDCAYCQLGPTTSLTVERTLFVPVAEVVAQVAAAVARGPRPQIITFAGSGEPTLYLGLGEVARRLRELAAIPLLLITNGSLLHRPDVAEEAALFDLVAPSLDAGDEESFRRINQPHPSLSLEQVAAGIAAFAARWPEKVRLELFLASGFNDGGPALEALVSRVKGLGVRHLDLNTAVRPTPGRQVAGVSEQFLLELAGRFDPPAVPIAAFAGATGAGSGEPESLADRLLATLARRPSTREDLAAAVGLAPEALTRALQELAAAGRVYTQQRGDQLFFVAH